MKRVFIFISTIFILFSSLQAAAQIDSLSYVYGHYCTLGTLVRKSVMKNENDFRDYIRGLEENTINSVAFNDSSYMVSYMFGAMEAIFVTDGLLHTEDEKKPPLECIIDGLRKVADGKIVLPADTIAAMSIINKFTEENKDILDVDEDNKCQFFTAYGTMKAFQPGLESYIREMMPGTKCVENRKAFAAGMADVFELNAEKPESAYTIGKGMVLAYSINALSNKTFDFPSFVAGAKAALGLGEEYIAPDEIESFFERSGEWSVLDEPIKDDKYYKTVADYLSKLQINLFTKYKVDWTVTAGVVSKDNSQVSEVFATLIGLLGLNDEKIAGVLMIQPQDENGSIYEKATEAIASSPLPEGFKWFCGRKDNNKETSIGIMATSHLYSANVNEASVEVTPNDNLLFAYWYFNYSDALKWSDFTEANVGNFIAVEINGTFIFAPKINSPITSGACSSSGLSPEEVNSLFKDAEMLPQETGVELIEVK